VGVLRVEDMKKLVFVIPSWEGLGVGKKYNFL